MGYLRFLTLQGMPNLVSLSFILLAEIFLSKEIVLGHPCIPRGRVDTGSDKRPGMRKKGGAGGEGGGGERGREHIRGTKG